MPFCHLRYIVYHPSYLYFLFRIQLFDADAPSPVGIYSKLYAPTGRDMRLWESSAPAEKETGKGLPSQSLALARFAGRYPSRPSIAAHRAVLSRMEGMRTRSSVVWICSAMAERASTVGTP